MTQPTDNNEAHDAAETVRRKAKRMEEAKLEGQHTVWYGLGMFGLVGWAVAVPTLLGVVIGVWLDRVAPQDFSWRLALLLAGVVLGCFNAWWWVSRESRDE